MSRKGWHKIRVLTLTFDSGQEVLFLLFRRSGMTALGNEQDNKPLPRGRAAAAADAES